MSRYLSAIQPLAPLVPGWHEMDVSNEASAGYPIRAFRHQGQMFQVFSAVEVAKDADDVDRGPEYHLSMTQGTRKGGIRRVRRADALVILRQFGLAGAEEDNHVPHGYARHFWRPVADSLVGLECACKDDEPAIREDVGDFVWRPHGG